MATADDPEVHTLTLSGPVTLYESSDVREALAAALAEGKPLRVNLETSGPWDLAGLQLLISAVATGRKAGLPVRLVQVPGVCREIAERSGLGDWLAEATESFH
jgi:ABC-type transporter Mla MlaB component